MQGRMCTQRGRCSPALALPLSCELLGQDRGGGTQTPRRVLFTAAFEGGFLPGLHRMACGSPQLKRGGNGWWLGQR